MRFRIAILLFWVFAAFPGRAAMLRVVAIEDGRTVTVEQHGRRTAVTLAGVAITDEAGAKALLEWTLAAKWIAVEPAAGGALVYRSPDALFINRELVVRGFARATLPGIEPPPNVAVTYLGTIDLPWRGSALRTSPERGSGSGASRRPPAAPSRKARTRR